MKFEDHPFYKAQAEQFELYQDLFDGSHEQMANQHLILHNIERSQLDGAAMLLRARKERSFYTNHASRIFKRYVGLLFKNPVRYDDEAEKLLEEYGALEDIDGQGNSIDEFLKRVIFKDRFLFGQVYLMTDATRAEDNILRTVEQRRQQGIRPFWKTIAPLATKDWQFYKGGPNIGKLKGLRAEFSEILERDDLAMPAKEEKGFYVYQMEGGAFTVYRYLLESESSAEVELAQVITLPKITDLPIATVKQIDSYIKDVQPHTLKAYNLDSNISNILHHQGYQEKNIIGNVENKQMKAGGEYVNNIFPIGTEIVVSQPVYPQGLIEERNRSEGEVWKTAFHLTRMMPSDSKDGESADTLEKQREDLKSFIVTELQSLEALLNRGLQHFAMFAGQPNFQGKFELDKNVDLSNFEEEIQSEIAYAEDIKRVPTWRKSVLKKRAREMQVENLEQIEIEIDALKEEKTPAENAANEVLANADA